jgi:hypothetical protein
MSKYGKFRGFWLKIWEMWWIFSGKNPLHGKIPRIRVLHGACCESKSLYPILYPLIGTNKIKYLLKTGVG